jgi:hypothetical protein
MRWTGPSTLALALLYRRCINSCGGTGNETTAGNDVQESTCANDQTARNAVQALRRAHLLIELFESASRSTR